MSHGITYLRANVYKSGAVIVRGEETAMSGIWIKILSLKILSTIVGNPKFHLSNMYFTISNDVIKLGTLRLSNFANLGIKSAIFSLFSPQIHFLTVKDVVI